MKKLGRPKENVEYGKVRANIYVSAEILDEFDKVTYARGYSRSRLLELLMEMEISKGVFNVKERE